MATETQTGSPRLDVDDGGHERLAHYVIGGSEAILKAMVTGEPCTAFCGKVWVPDRDPEKYPVCRTCEDVARRVGKLP